jgi:hypothetical protein
MPSYRSIFAGFARRSLLAGRRTWRPPLRRAAFESLERRQLLHASPPLELANMAEGEGATEQVADFALVDVNPASASHNQPVSPRDYLQQVSAWYFGHAT